MDKPMTPEERFTKIENLMETMAERQARHDDEILELRAMQKGVATHIEILTSTTKDLAGVSRYLVNVQGELIESNALLRQLVAAQAKRMDRLEGENRN